MKHGQSSWIPVSGAGIEKNNFSKIGDKMERKSMKSNANQMILMVEKALRIGVPLFFVLFTGFFIAVGLYLKS